MATRSKRKAASNQKEETSSAKEQKTEATPENESTEPPAEDLSAVAAAAVTTTSATTSAVDGSVASIASAEDLAAAAKIAAAAATASVPDPVLPAAPLTGSTAVPTPLPAGGMDERKLGTRNVTKTKILQHLVGLWDDNKELVEKALGEVVELCHSETEDYQENIKLLHQQNGVKAIADAMKKWITYVTIQSVGCCALGNTVSRDQSAADVAAAGALDALILALKNHKNDSFVQGYGCTALGNMMCTSKDNAKYVVDTLSGIDYFVEAARNFPKNKHVQQGVSCALANLSLHADFRSRIIDAGAQQPLLEWLENSEDGSLNKKLASKALQNLLDE